MKKKVLTLMVIAVLGFSSCKKDELVTPAKPSPEKIADKSVVGTWDQLNALEIQFELLQPNSINCNT